jgi:DNA polymerase-1
MKNSKKLFLLDGMALVFRAYYAMVKSPRLTSKNLNTSAILGFTNTLLDVLKTEQPTHIAVSFDTGAPTIRHADFEQYKAHREATPDDIVQSIPYIYKMLEAFRIPILLKDGYEADDVIGTAAKYAEIEGFEVFMMTSDKDYGQLVSEHIRIYKPGKFGQKSEVLTQKDVCEKYNIQNPEQLIDILGLWGDASDNIPGVPNIGIIKAQQLIRQFQSIENLYLHINEVENDRMRQTLIENKEQAFLSKSLATIILNVPLYLNFEEMLLKEPDITAIKKLFEELEFRALWQRFSKDYQQIFSVPLPSASSQVKMSQVPDLFSDPNESFGMLFNTENSRYERFSQFQHALKEVHTEVELESVFSENVDFLSFEWIVRKEKIIGFAWKFAHHLPVCYHISENNQSDIPFLKTIFSIKNMIVTVRTKEIYKLLKNKYIENNATLFDLEIAHYIMQADANHQLIRLSEQYLNYAVLDSENLDVSIEKSITIAQEKVEIYERLYSIFSQELKKNQLEKLFKDIEMPLVTVLADMEMNGIKLDVNVLQENSDELNTDLKNLENKIFEYAGTSFNLASPRQLGEILFSKLKIIDNAKLTKTKQYQTGEDVLLRLVHKHPIISLILEWRTLSKLKSTYIDALPLLINSETGKIHTTFNQTVASTGRLSSMNPNLQNIPIRTERGRDIRKAFVSSDEDHIVLAADYSQIELRIVAAVCQDERMLAAFQRGEDIHSSMAAHIYHVSIDQVTPEMRRNAKTVNFGILYGMSAFGLADSLQIPQKEARNLIDDYFSGFPKINEYIEKTLQFAQEHGYVETLLGRRRYIWDILSSNAILRKASERNAINAPIQGTAADLIKIAMIRISNAIKENRLKSKMCLQVHDELVFDVPKIEVEILTNLVEKNMSSVLQLSVPLLVDIKWGKNWFEAH